MGSEECMVVENKVFANTGMRFGPRVSAILRGKNEFEEWNLWKSSVLSDEMVVMWSKMLRERN